MKVLGLYLCILLCSLTAKAQTKRLAVSNAITLQLKNGYVLLFPDRENHSGLYRHPRIKVSNEIREIEGFDKNNFSSPKIKLSPDGRYVTMEYIIKGYVMQSAQDSVLHENYGCVIVDLKQSKVVQYLQSECDGAWNKKNEWISNERVVFSKEEDR